MQKYIPVALLIILGVSSRLLPHPANFAPIAAIGLFSGLYLPKKFAVLLPGITLLISDFILGFYLWPVMVSVYACFIITSFMGMSLQQNKKILSVVERTLLASILFFLATNWAVWAFGSMYPHTMNGLWQSYLMALPFFKNTLLGDLFYTGVLIGGMELILAWQRARIVSRVESV